MSLQEFSETNAIAGAAEPNLTEAMQACRAALLTGAGMGESSSFFGALIGLGANNNPAGTAARAFTIGQILTLVGGAVIIRTNPACQAVVEAGRAAEEGDGINWDLLEQDFEQIREEGILHIDFGDPIEPFLNASLDNTSNTYLFSTVLGARLPSGELVPGGYTSTEQYGAGGITYHYPDGRSITIDGNDEIHMNAYGNGVHIYNGLSNAYILNSTQLGTLSWDMEVAAQAEADRAAVDYMLYCENICEDLRNGPSIVAAIVAANAAAEQEAYLARMDDIANRIEIGAAVSGEDLLDFSSYCIYLAAELGSELGLEGPQGSTTVNPGPSPVDQWAGSLANFGIFGNGNWHWTPLGGTVLPPPPPPPPIDPPPSDPPYDPGCTGGYNGWCP